MKFSSFKGCDDKMMRFCHQDLRWHDSCESIRRFAGIDSLILGNRFRVPELNPLFCESHFGGLKSANRRFKAIRANRSHVMKIAFVLRIDSRESPRFALRIAGPSKIRTDRMKALR